MSYEKVGVITFDSVTVGDMIEALQKLPKNIPFYFCGSQEGYLFMDLGDNPCCSADCQNPLEEMIDNEDELGFNDDLDLN